nr:ARM REPEAT PROTEIN INTERACTING WITH ABF2-like [Ipomoea batatas]
MIEINIIVIYSSGKRFYAHRICLLASSDAFRAMFDGGYRERDAKDIEIPNIRWDIFELMMRYIYTGTVDVNLEIAQELLRAADQYLLEGLKRLCEYTIAQVSLVGAWGCLFFILLLFFKNENDGFLCDAFNNLL